MEREKTLLTVKEAAKKANVSDETIRRWIRSKKLRGTFIGKSLFIDPWQLDIALSLGQTTHLDNYNLMTAAIGLDNAMKGALIFDNAFFSLELQFSRIKEDHINLESGILRQKKEFESQRIALHNWTERLKQVNTEKLPDRPSIGVNNNHWSTYLKILFTDIHFYFITGALIDIATKRLKKDINDEELNIIIDKYANPMKDLNDARNDLEHIDERIDRVSDLGNITNGHFHFNNRSYDLYFEDINRLRDDLCDYLLRKTQKELRSQ